MALEKSDLKQIERIVEKSADSIKKELRKEIQLSAESTKKVLRQEIKTEVGGAENRIIATINREVGDLAEINRAVIQKVSQIDDLDKRVTRIEHKVGIVAK